MKSVKFLLMFVLMLSIASVNVDAQRRRSYYRSRSRSTTTQANRQAPAKNTNAEPEFYTTGYHIRTMERIENAFNYAKNNLSTSEQIPYILRAIYAEGNHGVSVQRFTDNWKHPVYTSFEITTFHWISENGNTSRWKITYFPGAKFSNVPVEMIITKRSDGHQFITKVWYGDYGSGY